MNLARTATVVIWAFGLGHLFWPALASSQCTYIFADGFEAGEECEWQSECAANSFEVRDAVATSATTVVVCFNHQVDATTLLGGGQQFLFSAGLSATTASPASRNVVVTTLTQTPGQSYVVQVLSSLQDGFGNGVSNLFNSASFEGFTP